MSFMGRQPKSLLRETPGKCTSRSGARWAITHYAGHGPDDSR
jgi:hypothetical protein